MDLSQTGTLKQIPISQMNPSTINGRIFTLRSRTVDTFLHILSVCYTDSSHIDQNSDKVNTNIESVTKNDVLLDCTDILPNDFMGGTRVVLDTQEDGLYSKLMESADTQVVLDNQKGGLDSKLMESAETQVVLDNQEGGLDSKLVESAETQVVLDTQEGGLDSKLVESAEIQVVLDNQEGGLDNKLVESAETQVVLDAQEGCLPIKLMKSAETQVVLDTQEGGLDNKVMESSETQVVLDTQEGGLDNKLMESSETQVVLDTQEGGLDNKVMESSETQVVLDTQEGGLDNKLMESSETQVVLDTQEGGLDNKLMESSETQVVLDTQEGGLDNKLMESSETQVVLDTQEGGLDNKLMESFETQVNLDGTDITLNDSLSQLQMLMDLDIQEDILCDEHMESVECDDNLLIETNSLSQKTDTIPSISFDIKDQDNFDKDFEEGEISGEFMDFMPENNTESTNSLTGTEMGLGNGNNLIPLSADTVEDVGKDLAEVVTNTARNLVDYSEIFVPKKPREYAKPVTTAEHVLPLLSNLKNSATKNQDLVYPYKRSCEQNNKKRERSCTEEERAIKMAKKSADKKLTSLGENLNDASQLVVDASANKGASNEKKKKRVLTKERKAKKKRKERIKRAENNRKLGVKRLKLEPMIKEKKITYCRHYMMGRCHEGEKCKFSHDTIPLTKSKPCCHFARQACMKGDDCPFDHELSKYPCNNFLTTGFCNRGSDCMFSHEAKPSEANLDASKESKSEQKVNTISCSVPKEQNTVKITPKLPATPPKGISFLSQKITKTPPIYQDSKEITKTPPLIQYSKKKTKTSPVTQETKEMTEKEEITKTPPVIPRGINFLSFGKKPGLDQSSSGFSFKISKGIERSRLSSLDDNKGLKFESKLNAVNEVKVKVDFLTDGPSSSQKPIGMLPFMSSISQKSLQSTLDFAAKFESGVKTKRQI